MAAIETGFEFYQYHALPIAKGRDLDRASDAVGEAVSRFFSQDQRQLDADLIVPSNERLWVVRDCLVATRYPEDQLELDLSLISREGNYNLVELIGRLSSATARAVGKYYVGEGVIWQSDYSFDMVRQKVSPTVGRAVEAIFG